MSERAPTRAAAAIHAEWSAVALGEAGRRRVEHGIQARRAARRRRTTMRSAAVGAAAVAIAVATAIDPFGDESRGGPVRERAAAALSPGQTGLHYRARVTRTAGPLRSSSVEAWVAPGAARSRVIERDSSGRVWSKAVTARGRVTLWTRGRKRPSTFTVPRQFAATPTFLDARGLSDLQRALPHSAVAGPLTASGREVYELTSRSSVEGSVYRVVYVVDARTFAPVRHVRTLVRAAPNLVNPRVGDRVTTEFELFERR